MCQRSALDVQSGCCSTGERFTCDTCACVPCVGARRAEDSHAVLIVALHIIKKWNTHALVLMWLSNCPYAALKDLFLGQGVCCLVRVGVGGQHKGGMFAGSARGWVCRCNMEHMCCEEYEHCVSCCQAPQHSNASLLLEVYRGPDRWFSPQCIVDCPGLIPSASDLFGCQAQQPEKTEGTSWRWGCRAAACQPCQHQSWN